MVSAQEQKLVNILRLRFPDLFIIQSYRPNILKNDKTGNNYEIDIYIREFMVGFEFQGKPHFSKIYGMFNNPDNSRYNDCKKIDILHSIKTKITICEVFEVDLKGDILRNLITRLRNTADTYKNHNSFKRYSGLMLLSCYIESGINYKKVKLNYPERCLFVSNSGNRNKKRICYKHLIEQQKTFEKV